MPLLGSHSLHPIRVIGVLFFPMDLIRWFSLMKDHIFSKIIKVCILKIILASQLIFLFFIFQKNLGCTYIIHWGNHGRWIQSTNTTFSSLFSSFPGREMKWEENQRKCEGTTDLISCDIWVMHAHFIVQTYIHIPLYLYNELVKYGNKLIEYIYLLTNLTHIMPYLFVLKSKLPKPFILIPKSFSFTLHCHYWILQIHHVYFF